MDDQRKHGVLIAVLALLMPVVIAFGFIMAFLWPTKEVCQTGGISGPALMVDPASVPQGPIAGYGHEQLVNAAHIMLAAKDLGLSARDQQIGIMTAMGESSLRVIDYGDTAGPDSRGLFQQRANGAWGSYADRMNPYISATSFFKVERTIEGREMLEPTIVAHRVQRNADPYHYRPYWDPAGRVLAALGSVRPLTSTSPSGAPVQNNSSYNLGPVQPQTAAVANLLGPMFGIKTIGGYRESDPYPDHPSGLALDFMVYGDKATGDALAAYLIAHAQELGVDYLIWYQRSWSVARADEGWRAMEDRGDDTQNHLDHVHLLLNGDATSVAGMSDPCAPGVSGPVSADGWTKPSQGEITSPYGWRMHPIKHERRFHYGIDLNAACETPIWAANAGTVVISGRSGGYGNLIEIDHGNGVRTRYGHMYDNGLLVQVGQHVGAGQQIGRIGSSGWSTGCHLHFEVKQNGSNVDPAQFLLAAGVNL